jgi:hypothetical protein
MNNEQKLKIIKLLSAIESWGFATKTPLPDYLHDGLCDVVEFLSADILVGNAPLKALTNEELMERYREEIPKPKHTGVWIKHDGGECPVPVVANVMVRFRGVADQEGFRGKAAIWDWKHYGKSSDITHYMIVE